MTRRSCGAIAASDRTPSAKAAGSAGGTEIPQSGSSTGLLVGSWANRTGLPAAKNSQSSFGLIPYAPIPRIRQAAQDLVATRLIERVGKPDDVDEPAHLHVPDRSGEGESLDVPSASEYSRATRSRASTISSIRAICARPSAAESSFIR